MSKISDATEFIVGASVIAAIATVPAIVTNVTVDKIEDKFGHKAGIVATLVVLTGSIALSQRSSRKFSTDIADIIKASNSAK